MILIRINVIEFQTRDRIPASRSPLSNLSGNGDFYDCKRNLPNVMTLLYCCVAVFIVMRSRYCSMLHVWLCVHDTFLHWLDNKSAPQRQF